MTRRVGAPKSATSHPCGPGCVQKQEYTHTHTHTQHWISRLWCVFELAAFLRAEQGVRKPVHLVPVKTAKVVVLQCLCWMLLSVSYELIKEVTQADVHTSVESDEDATLVLLQLALLLIIFTGIVLFILPAMIYIGLGITHEISELNAQLARFRVQDVQCFCCSINHRHPSTQATVPCDRELVHRMLRQWFSSSTTNHCLCCCLLFCSFIFLFNQCKANYFLPGGLRLGIHTWTRSTRFFKKSCRLA